MIRFLSFVFLFTLLMHGYLASASNFSLGIGGQWNQATLPATTQHLDATYSGSGGLIDARVRFGEPRVGDLGADFFGELGYATGTNSAQGASENMAVTEYGGGLDLRRSIFFVGCQYMMANAAVTGGALAQTTNLGVASFGLRAGLNFQLGDQTSLMAGGVYQEGTSSVSPAINQSLRQLSFFLVLHYSLITDVVHLISSPTK